MILNPEDLALLEKLLLQIEIEAFSSCDVIFIFPIY